MSDDPDSVGFAVFNLALTADPARAARFEQALLELSTLIGATPEDRATAVAHAAANIARGSVKPDTLLASIFTLARFHLGSDVACDCQGFCRCADCRLLHQALGAARIAEGPRP